MAKYSNNLIIPEEFINSKIYVTRDIKVMLDRDLADLFNVKAIRLREQVKRTKEQFPLHFMFQLSEGEVEIMVSQNAIPSKQHFGGFLPYAFSEYGVLQLNNVLKINIAMLLFFTPWFKIQAHISSQQPPSGSGGLKYSVFLFYCYMPQVRPSYIFDYQ